VGFNPIDPEALRVQVRSAEPFPFVRIGNFLDGKFARASADSFPSFEQVVTMGRSFSSVNEQRKVQVSDSSRFPGPILELHELLASREWLDALEYIMDIPDLVPGPELVGGGIHETGPHGLLDVHVDFNYLKDRDLHRRLNILVYFNPGWREQWGGRLELWDRAVQHCLHAFAPTLNRCIVFATSSLSFHGVTALTCPENMARRSFAAYYYTRQPPPDWDGKEHSTVFRARPNERFKGSVLMPGERAARAIRESVDGIKRVVRRKIV